MFKIVSGLIACVLAFEPAFAQNACQSEKGKMTVLPCGVTSGEEVKIVFNNLPYARKFRVFIVKDPEVRSTDNPNKCTTTFTQRRILDSDPQEVKTYELFRACVKGEVNLYIVLPDIDWSVRYVYNRL